MQVILASQSPRRRELLELFRFPFVIRVADIDETMDPSADPAEEVARLSLEKARAVACGEEDVVIAADTIVVCDGTVLGKPKSPRQAEEMLTMLSGRDHQVMTGMSVCTGKETVTRVTTTHIHFRELSAGEIRRYVATGEPMDKAGAYGIQGGAALFVQRLEGDYYNVMGLPVCPLAQILKEIAPQIMEDTQ